GRRLLKGSLIERSIRGDDENGSVTQQLATNHDLSPIPLERLLPLGRRNRVPAENNNPYLFGYLGKPSLCCASDIKAIRAAMMESSEIAIRAGRSFRAVIFLKSARVPPLGLIPALTQGASPHPFLRRSADWS